MNENLLIFFVINLYSLQLLNSIEEPRVYFKSYSVFHFLQHVQITLGGSRPCSTDRWNVSDDKRTGMVEPGIAYKAYIIINGVLFENTVRKYTRIKSWRGEIRHSP